MTTRRSALAYLVDTSVVTRVWRQPVLDALRPRTWQIGRPTVIDIEIGYSARNADEWDRLADRLDAFASVDIEAHHLRRAGQVQRMLADAGLRGRSVPDLIIAACAEDYGLTVLHYDADFDHIAAVTGQRTEWIVPAGSID